MDTDSAIRDAENAAELAVSEGRVEFDNVTFRYSGEYGCILRNVSFKVQSGETIAGVGRSGNGKSTLCLLIFKKSVPGSRKTPRRLTLS